MTPFIGLHERFKFGNEKALEYFSRRFHCSQAVLAAFAPECVKVKYAVLVQVHLWYWGRFMVSVIKRIWKVG